MSDRKTVNQIGALAEVRAVTEGHKAFLQQDGSYKVVSDTRPTSYRVTYVVLGYMDNLLHGSCSCPSGQNRQHLAIPCKHVSLVFRRLERENKARWTNGLFYGTEEDKGVLANCSDCGTVLADNERKAGTCLECLLKRVGA